MRRSEAWNKFNSAIVEHINTEVATRTHGYLHKPKTPRCPCATSFPSYSPATGGLAVHPDTNKPTTITDSIQCNAWMLQVPLLAVVIIPEFSIRSNAICMTLKRKRVSSHKRKRKRVSSHEWLICLCVPTPMIQQRVYVGHTAHLQSLRNPRHRHYPADLTLLRLLGRLIGVRRTVRGRTAAAAQQTSNASHQTVHRLFP